MSIHKLYTPKTSKIWYKALNAVGCYDLYALRIVIIVGKEDRKGGLGEYVVMSLMQEYKILGFNVTIDNFFKSLALARNLLEKNTKILGNIRFYQREIPSDVQHGKELPPVPFKICFHFSTGKHHASEL